MQVACEDSRPGTPKNVVRIDVDRREGVKSCVAPAVAAMMQAVPGTACVICWTKSAWENLELQSASRGN